MSELQKKHITIKFPKFRKIKLFFLYLLLFFQTLSYFSVSKTVARASDQAHSGKQEPNKFDKSELTIFSSDRRFSFVVEVAQSPVQLRQGLMDREKLPAGSGMLFDFGSLQIIHMWMKNTHIPLDMVFLDQVGNIISITTNAIPFSTNTISSIGPARAVLELYGGTVSRLGIKVGDRVSHEIFKP